MPTIDFCREQQRRAAKELRKKNPPAWARLALFDAFTEELLQSGHYLTYISFCSGIEAATVAWHPLQWSPLVFCEIDKFPSRVLAHHYPDIPNLGDFTAVDWSQFTGRADICVGGTPCQAFSVAGLRRSLADDRGNLSLEFIRAVNTIRPRFIVWENVPGVLSTSDNAFGCFLGALVGSDEALICDGGWPDAGVVDGPERRAAWRVLDAQYFGLAQRRKRVFVVASAGNEPHPAQILFEWESLRRDFSPCRETGEGVAHDVIGSLTSSGRGIERPGESRGQDPVIPVLYNAEGSDGATLTKSNIGKHINNQTPLVAIPLDLRNATRDPEKHDEQNRQGCGVGSNGDPAPTLTKEFVHGVDHTLRAKGHDASEDGTGRGVPLVAQTITADMYRSGGATAGNNPGVRNCLPDDMAVRRLTPRECERLQGFPDDYTAIPGAADGPRYKALGNSMAVPVMRWIGKRIQKAIQEANHAR